MQKGRQLIKNPRRRKIYGHRKKLGLKNAFGHSTNGMGSSYKAKNVCCTHVSELLRNIPPLLIWQGPAKPYLYMVYNVSQKGYYNVQMQGGEYLEVFLSVNRSRYSTYAALRS